MSRNSLLLVLTCIAGLLFTNVSAQPFLRLETGLHYAKISKVASDASGKYLLTASYDKTARMWDAATGQLLKTFRVQIGEDNNGKLYSCSLSPDGQIAAVGGWDEKNTIYLIHTQTGNIIHTITDLPEVIFDLDFSKDGRYLAAGLGNEYGVRIYDTQSWSERAKLDEYKSSGAAVTFDSQGRLAVVGGEGQIRLYSASFTFTKEIPSPGNLQPEKVAFNPSGTLLAIAYTNGSKVEVWDGYSLEKLYSPSVKRDNTDDGNLSSIAFSADGQSLYAGGSYAAVDSENKWKFAVRRWSSAGKGGYQDLLFFNNTIINFAPLPNGNLAVAGANPDLAVISGNNTIWHHISNENDYAITDVSHFKVNATGMALGFNSNNYEPQSFDLLTRTLVTETSYFPGPTSKNGGLEITDLKKTNGPLMNGKKASFVRSREQVFSADISSTGREAVFGTGWNLYKTDAAGTKVWSTALPETGWAVNISSNDKTVVVAMGDGTIRWYSMADGKELLAFYLRNDNKRWILFTPTGYYDAAPGAENFLGWHINNGFEKVPEFFPVSRFREQYYRPDVIDAILTTYNIDEAIKLANSRSQKVVSIIPANIQEKLPPTLTILSPNNGGTVSTKVVNVSYSVKTPASAPVRNIRVLVNGRPVSAERGIKVVSATNSTIDINIPEEDCTITLLAENEHGVSPEANLYIKYKAPVRPVDEFVKKPKLYVLAIGVSKYTNPDYDLNYAAADARGISAALMKQKAGLYEDVIVKSLIDKEATREAIQDGLQWVQDQTTQKDVAMIFFAGHGINDNTGNFYMLPSGADVARLRSTCVNFEDLKQTVSSISGKVVVFIDACHSGNVMGNTGRRSLTDINVLVNELSSTENGAITFTSSTGKEFSLEDPSWAHGAFTKALLEGLSGKASVPGKNKITVKSLDAYISERVKELTRGKQHPTSVVPPNVPDFPIAIGLQ